MGNTKSTLHTLPLPSGLYSVGCADILQGYSLEGIFMRLYYPIQKCDLSKHLAQLPPWIQRHEYVDGFADFLKFPSSIFRVAFNWGIGSISTPAVLNAPLLNANVVDRFPVIIFSHGLGANRTTYSTICCDMASHGFVVAAVEHRDNSASYSYCLKEKPNETPGVVEEAIRYRHIAAGEKEFPVRHAQVNTRVEECQKALRVLKSINNGEPINNLLPDSLDYPTFKGRMDFERTVIMGHSFGGATVIAAAAVDQEFKVGVVLDGWMFPLHNEIYEKINQPLLFINMEAFQWRDNILRMKRLDSSTVDRPMFTIRGSVHQSQTDMTFMLKGWLARKLHARGDIDPFLCNDINNELCLAFLRKHLNLPGNAKVDDVVQHYENWIIVGTNVNLNDVQSAL